ncbi:hypothetical protein [Glycomyces sp. NPDC021274]|jgi:hypothetical protein|uniref:hypothetical protein n=1 Tax=Glycomyces sp. NPDC021274 TaxID=3155120 RepID=UPI0033E8FFD1
MQVALSQRERLILLALLVHRPSIDVSIKELRSAFGFGIEKSERIHLIEAGFLTAIQAKGSTALLYTLTAAGRERSLAELSGEADPKSPLNLRVVYAVFNAVHRFLRRNHLTADVVFDAKEDLSAEQIDEEVSSSIGDAYRKLAEGRSIWVPLRELRAALTDVPRNHLDETLTIMHSNKVIHLISESNRKALKPVDHEAALDIAGDPKHFLAIGAE